MAAPANHVAAYRGEKRLEMGYKPLPLARRRHAFRDGGTYLITGGFGGIGQTLAADILSRAQSACGPAGARHMPERQHGTAISPIRHRRPDRAPDAGGDAA